MPFHRGRMLSAALLAAVLLLTGVAISVPAAYADEISDLQAQVEQSAQDYDAAVSRTEELTASIDETNSRIAQLEALLPRQKQEAGQIVKNEYVYQTNTSSFLSLILNCNSFEDFITSLDYYSRINEYHDQVIQATINAKNELEASRNQLASEKSEAEVEEQKAAIALQAAQDARELAMQKAAEKAAAEAAAQAAQTQSIPASAPNDSDNASKSSGSDSPISGSVSAGDVNWSTDKKTFVNQWSSRINNYLDGSPLSGYGTAFAAAAWDYGVDPRWSPAISYVESSKGEVCFRSHNAWGWGSSSWSSWDEAIDAHVSGLARIYGSTLTYEAAQKYCPPNSQYWYNTCLEQMNEI